MESWKPQDYLKRVIHDFVFYRRSTLSATTWFRDQKHDADLLPSTEIQLDRIISQFDRYHRTVHDFQGPRDRGVDVVVKYGSQEEAGAEEYQYIGFQIKSFPEIGQQGWLTILKAQCLEAMGRGLTDYYVMFCTDVVHHKRSLRAAYAELVDIPGVTIVSPEFAYTFLNLSEHELAAYLKAKLSQEDAVFAEAADSLSELTITEAAVVIDLLVRYLVEGEVDVTLQRLRNASFLSNVYLKYPDVERDFYFYDTDRQGQRYAREHIRERSIDERFEDDFAFLEAKDLFQTNSRDDTVRPQLEDYRAIQAVMLDAVARHGYDADELREYTLNALMEDQISDTLEFLRNSEE